MGKNARSICTTWPRFRPQPGSGNSAAASADGQSAEVYRQALSGLIDAGQRYRRLDPRRQLIVIEGGDRVVPIRYFGFAWRPDDFSRLTSAEHRDSQDIAHNYACPGLGLPLVGERTAGLLTGNLFPPLATVCRDGRVAPAADDASGGCGGQVLELYNPLALDTVVWAGVSQPLARDLTAPLAAIVNEAPRQYLRGFTAPTDTSVQPQLLLIEPYQRGKIPVVFIHGLYSDPITWVDMVNELRAQSDLYDHFQFWTFRYPTGGEVLESAAVLRQRLKLARDTFDPEHTDPALDAMVLVGHSLGGLVSEMQITTRTTCCGGRGRAAVRTRCVLGRNPGTFGAGILFRAGADGQTGRLHRHSFSRQRIDAAAGRLHRERRGQFRYGRERAVPATHRPKSRLVQADVQRRRPTTIDLLDPESPFLGALAQMPIPCKTHLHTIIGTGGACFSRAGRRRGSGNERPALRRERAVRPGQT